MPSLFLGLETRSEEEEEKNGEICLRGLIKMWKLQKSDSLFKAGTDKICFIKAQNVMHGCISISLQSGK